MGLKDLKGAGNTRSFLISGGKVLLFEGCVLDAAGEHERLVDECESIDLCL